MRMGIPREWDKNEITHENGNGKENIVEPIDNYNVTECSTLYTCI